MTGADGSKIRLKVSGDEHLVEAAGVGKDGVKHELHVLKDRQTFAHRIGKERIGRDYFMTRAELYANGKRTLTVTSAIAPMARIAILRARVEDQEVACAIDFSHAHATHRGLVTRVVTVGGKRVDAVTKPWDASSATAPFPCDFGRTFADLGARTEYFASVLTPFSEASEKHVAEVGGVAVDAWPSIEALVIPAGETKSGAWVRADLGLARALLEQAAADAYISPFVRFLTEIEAEIATDILTDADGYEPPRPPTDPDGLLDVPPEDPSQDEPGEEPGEGTSTDDGGDLGEDGPGGDPGGDTGGDTGGCGLDVSGGIHIQRMCE